MRIQSKLTLIGGLLFVVLAANAADHFLNDHQTWRDATQSVALNAAADRLYDVAADTAIERGLTNILVRGPALRTPANLEALRSTRAKVDAEIVAALAQARGLLGGLAQFDAGETIVDREFAALMALRGEADAAFATGAVWSDDRAQGWFDQATRVVDALRVVRGHVEAQTPMFGRGTLAAMQTKRSLWQMVEHIGRERGTLSGIIAEKRPLRPAEELRLNSYRALVESSWFVAEGHAPLLGGAAERAVARAGQTVFGPYEALRQRTYAEARRGEYATSPDAFFAEATQAISTLREAKRETSRHMTALLGQRQADAWANMLSSAGAMGFGITMLALVIWLGQRQIGEPLARIRDAITAIDEADGGFDLSRDARQSSEIGAIARAVSSLRDHLVENAALRRQQDDLRAAAAQRQREAIDEMTAEVEHETGIVSLEMAERSRSIAAHAEHMAQRMDHVSLHARSVADAAAAALASIAKAADTTAGISDAMAGIGSAANTASSNTQAAVQSGRDARRRIEALEAAVSQIGEVAAMIGTVAHKTNMLALNATVEAARAGDAGKGFAVVALEVKTLAGQTALATEEVSRLVKAVHDAMHEVASGVSAIENQITGIDQIAGRISQAVNEQAQSAVQIRDNVAEASAAAHDVAEHIDFVSQDTADGSSIANTVRATCMEMHARVGELQHTLTRLIRQSASAADRRVSQRFTLTQEVVLLSAQGTHEGRAVDLSLGGARLAMEASLPVGMPARLRIPAWQIEMAAEVVGTMSGALRLRFTDANGPALRNHLAERLAALAPAARAA